MCMLTTTELENRKSIDKKSTKPKKWSFRKINKIKKPLARLRQKERIQITNTRNEEGTSLQFPWI